MGPLEDSHHPSNLDGSACAVKLSPTQNGCTIQSPSGVNRHTPRYLGISFFRPILDFTVAVCFLLSHCYLLLPGFSSRREIYLMQGWSRCFWHPSGGHPVYIEFLLPLSPRSVSMHLVDPIIFTGMTQVHSLLCLSFSHSPPSIPSWPSAGRSPHKSLVLLKVSYC